MDNLGNNDINGPVGSSDSDKPIPFDSVPDDSPGVSRAPLNLGGGGGKSPTPAPKPTPPVRPAPRKVVTSTPIAAPGGASVSSFAGERITGMKVFFAKLHAGAIDFLSEQISNWLKDHPDVHIKHTNIATGDIQAKKTEPNLIITLWY